jgi:hypothetical protein
MNKSLVFVALAMAMLSCNNEQGGRTVEKIDGPNPKADTNLLITDSVAVPDTTTANIDPMKKIN